MSNYTALELLPTWYGKTQVKPSPEELQSVQKAIEEIVAVNDFSFWKCIILLLSEKSEGCDDDQLKKLMKALTDADPSFPLQNNKKLLKTIAGIALNVKLDGEPSSIGYTIALSLKNFNYLGQFEGFDEFETSKYADQVLATESRTNDGGVNEAEEKLSSLNTSYEDLEDEENGLINSELKEIFQILKAALEANKFLGEEVNTLWWIFGEYSSTVKKSFVEVGPTKMAFYGPYELSEKISISKGLEASQQYLNKVLSLSSNAKPVSKVTIFDLVNSFEVDEFKPTFNKIKAKVSTLTPILFAFNSSLLFNVTDDWSGYYEKHSNGGNVKTEFTITSIASQLFREFLLLKLI